MADKVTKSEQEWMQQLTPEQFQICRLKGTERPFTGKYNIEKSAGVYKCICCGHPLFDAETKYESGSGWPSFFAPISEDDRRILAGEVEKLVVRREFRPVAGETFFGRIGSVTCSSGAR